MTTQTTLTASPAKLRDGSWGIRFTTAMDKATLEYAAREVDSDPMLVTVQTRAGKSWTARLSGVISCRKDKRNPGKYNVLATTAPFAERKPAATRFTVRSAKGGQWNVWNGAEMVAQTQSENLAHAVKRMCNDAGEMREEFVAKAEAEIAATTKSAPSQSMTRKGICIDCGDDGFADRAGYVLCWDCRDIRR